MIGCCSDYSAEAGCDINHLFKGLFGDERLYMFVWFSSISFLSFWLNYNIVSEAFLKECLNRVFDDGIDHY